jgi:glycosyltransferase involved in cell wall biosynthesis
MQPAQRGGVRATVIHDLVPHHHPEWCTPRTVSMHRRKDRDAMRRADPIVVNSRFTRDDVSATLSVPLERLVVAHPGVAAGLGLDGARRDLGERPAILGVGTIEPRKNLGRLIQAWRLLGDDFGLTLAGGEGWGDRPDLADARITRLGYVPDAELGALYRGAAVYVYPSLVEGFGLPVVEAMACGTPVVASAHPSLDEACGGAAVRVDPLDPAAIAAGIEDALSRRDELVPLGLAHAARFSWAETGRIVLAAIEARA